MQDFTCAGCQMQDFTGAGCQIQDLTGADKDTYLSSYSASIAAKKLR